MVEESFLLLELNRRPLPPSWLRAVVLALTPPPLGSLGSLSWWRLERLLEEAAGPVRSSVSKTSSSTAS